MKRYPRFFIILFTVLSFCSCIRDKDEPVWSLEPGDRLPQFSVTLNDGETVATESLRGKSSVIVFFNTSCDDCQRELPVLQKRYEKYISDGNDIAFFCISREEGEESIARYWRENGLTMPYSAQKDRRIYNLFASSIIPRVYEADADLIITSVQAE